jgi:hypothetical protein
VAGVLAAKARRSSSVHCLWTPMSWDRRYVLPQPKILLQASVAWLGMGLSRWMAMWLLFDPFVWVGPKGACAARIVVDRSTCATSAPV